MHQATDSSTAVYVTARSGPAALHVMASVIAPSVAVVAATEQTNELLQIPGRQIAREPVVMVGLAPPHSEATHAARHLVGRRCRSRIDSPVPP